MHRFWEHPKQQRIVSWCNGSTAVFGSACLGSNPGETTIEKRFDFESNRFFYFVHNPYTIQQQKENKKSRYDMYRLLALQVGLEPTTL